MKKKRPGAESTGLFSILYALRPAQQEDEHQGHGFEPDEEVERLGVGAGGGLDGAGGGGGEGADEDAEVHDAEVAPVVRRAEELLGEGGGDGGHRAVAGADEHHHHHDGECDDPACSCHHHHHHADEVFTSWGAETPKTFTEADIDRVLTALDGGEYGAILRAKGIVPCEGGKWLHFDYVPQEHEVRFGPADYTGRLCVIGSNLDEGKLAELFGL